MRVKKNVIIALWLCFLPLATLSANAQSAIQPAAEALDYRFFHKLVNKDMLGQAYAQAQVEDFEPGEKELFTSKMLGYFKYPMSFWDRKVRSLDGLWQLESQLATLEGEAGHELLQEWRYTFLSKMMTFMQEKASRKALFRLTLTSKTEYNSNVNRINDGDVTLGSGANEPKDDWQQLLTMNLKWYPLVNHKGFSKNNKFEQGFNVMNIHQMSHESNEVLIFDTESKYTRMLNNDLLDDFSLAYRAQNFGLSGKPSSRHTQSKSYSHRLKADWNFKFVKLGEGTFKETKTTLSLGYLKKKQFDESKVIAGKNADDWTFDWDQDFDYVLGKHDGSFKTTLGYRYYDTKNDPSGDYDYFLIKLSHKSDYSVGFLTQPLKVSQELSYRTKDWDLETSRITSTTGTPMDEDFTYAQVKAETKVCKSTKVSLSAKQAWRGRDMTLPNGSKKANQTIVALGLNWSAP